MKVKVIDVKTGMVKTMPEKYARILVKMKRARWLDQEGQQSAAEPTQQPAVGGDPPAEIRASKAAKALAESSDIDLSKVAGTGNDGAITKPDVEAFIESKKQQE